MLSNCLLFLARTALKAEFSITIIVPDGMTCLSNMNEARATDLNNVGTGTSKKQKAATFQRSPRMSTYLDAFVVGELKPVPIPHSPRLTLTV